MLPAGAILLGAALAAWLGLSLPDTLAGLRTLGPYAVLVAAAAVATWFNRERALVLTLSLVVAFAAYDKVATPAAVLAGAVLVPLNAFLALVFRERGARFGQGWKWVALIALEVLLVYLVQEGYSADTVLTRVPPEPPLIARLAFSAAFAAAVWRTWPNHTPLEVGLAAALAAYYVACNWAREPGTYSLFVAAAGTLILVAVLQESYRMAFRDALTGLPNRRALEDELRALAAPYAIAMVDVDHFKKFNDTHGHDIGDQVLRLVAARLGEAAAAARGVRAFRYGGEEFTVLFRGQRLSEAQPQLEAMRNAVQMYKMTVRGKDRPKDAKEGSQRRARAVQDFERTDKILSVTVSIGCAEPGKRLKTPAEVVKGADEALYRAKEKGRNQVSR